MKLNQDQIEAIRAAVPELAEQLEAGESVTVEREVKRWEPEHGNWYATTDGKVIRQMSNPSVMIDYNRNGVQRKTREAAERLARDQRIFNLLHAYREEFAPGYVVPPVGCPAYHPFVERDGQWTKGTSRGRSPTTVYMPEEIVDSLVEKLKSGEVVL